MSSPCRFWLVVTLGLILVGCSTPKNTPPPSPVAKPAEPPTPRMVPVTSLFGRIVQVNAALRYAVIDFGVGNIPRPGDRLDVFRAGQKVGEMRVSNQARGGIIAADIMTGDVQELDEARTR